MIGKLKSGEVVVDRYRSHLHNGLVRLLPEALARVEARGRKFLVEVVDFGQSVGETICVSTRPGDQIVFAKRPGRFGLTRFVKNREPELCSSVVVILKEADSTGGMVLITAFVGGKPEPEPWDRSATADSRAFWNSHALIWGAEEVIPGTETFACPW